MPMVNKQNDKYDKDECWTRDEEIDIEWESFDLSKGAKPLQQHIKYDDQGAMHFLV